MKNRFRGSSEHPGGTLRQTLRKGTIFALLGVASLAPGSCLVESTLQSTLEPLQEADNRSDPHLTDRTTGKREVAVALLAATDDCPFFHCSGYNMDANWGLLLTSSLEDEQKNFFVGHANNRFLDRGDIEICKMALIRLKDACILYGKVNLSSDCNSNNPITQAHFGAFAICAGALKSSMTFPWMFF